MNIGQNAARLERPNATRQPLTARITRCGPILAIRTEERRHLGRATRRPSRRFCFSVAKRPSGRPPLRRSSRTSSGSSDDPASGSCIHDERKSEPGDFSLTWLLLRNDSGSQRAAAARRPPGFCSRSKPAAIRASERSRETAVPGSLIAEAVISRQGWFSGWEAARASGHLRSPCARRVFLLRLDGP
jgi:hypothetical protein